MKIVANFTERLTSKIKILCRLRMATIIHQGFITHNVTCEARLSEFVEVLRTQLAGLTALLPACLVMRFGFRRTRTPLFSVDGVGIQPSMLST